MFYIQRYHKIEKVNYTFEVVTPMFIGGADQNEAELRVPSIKGMLRFWWRALYGTPNIKETKKKESEIFGDTANKSLVAINILNDNLQTSLELFYGRKFNIMHQKRQISLDILHYLAFGPVEYDKKIKRLKVAKEYISPNSKFEIEFKCHDKYIDETKNALKYFISYGGLGSKSRNGFGSLYSENLITKSLPRENNLKSYSSFSKDTKIIFFNEYDSWEEALSSIGLAYREARLSLEQTHNYEKRALMSKPIEANNIPDHIRKERHAKPYFLHINKLNNGKYQGQILFMPYKYKDPEKMQDYLNTCKQMNDKIEELSGGNKWQ